MWRAAGGCAAAPRTPASAVGRRRWWLPRAAAAACGAVLVATSSAADRRLATQLSSVLRWDCGVEQGMGKGLALLLRGVLSGAALWARPQAGQGASVRAKLAVGSLFLSGPIAPLRVGVVQPTSTLRLLSLPGPVFCLL